MVINASNRHRLAFENIRVGLRTIRIWLSKLL